MKLSCMVAGGIFGQETLIFEFGLRLAMESDFVTAAAIELHGNGLRRRG